MELSESRYNRRELLNWNLNTARNACHDKSFQNVIRLMDFSLQRIESTFRVCNFMF